MVTEWHFPVVSLLARVLLARLALVASLLVLMAGCVSTPVDAPPQEPVIIVERVVVDGDVLPLPEEPQIRTETLPAEQQVSPVVRRLLVAALDQSSRGESEAAAASLERALRIEPRNAVLWGRLADVRYEQQNWQQAVQLAAKSNTLAGSNQRLRRENWYLMVNAYEAMGDAESAERYRQKLARPEPLLR